MLHTCPHSQRLALTPPHRQGQQCWVLPSSPTHPSLLFPGPCICHLHKADPSWEAQSARSWEGKVQEHTIRLHTVGEHTQSACYVNAHFGYILGHMLWECILGVHAVGTHTRGSRCRTTYLGCVRSEDTIGVHSWAFCCRGLGGSGPGAADSRGVAVARRGGAGQTWEPLPGSRAGGGEIRRADPHVPSSPRPLSNHRQGRQAASARAGFICYEKTSADLGRPLSRRPRGSAHLASQLPEISPGLGGAAGLQPFRAVPEQPRSHGHGAGGLGAPRLSWGGEAGSSPVETMEKPRADW